jgi:predicted GIY-YIG superfamily endonuclease
MHQENRRWWLYVLKLEQEKWYVGITTKDPQERFFEHVHHKRAAYWTMKYKPIAIEMTEDLGIVSKEHAEKYENKVARGLMKERGINNVRGGDLTQVDDYVGRFGYIWDKFGWEAITVIVLEMLVIIYLCIDKYFLH